MSFLRATPLDTMQLAGVCGKRELRQPVPRFSQPALHTGSERAGRRQSKASAGRPSAPGACVQADIESRACARRSRGAPCARGRAAWRSRAPPPAPPAGRRRGRGASAPCAAARASARPAPSCPPSAPASRRRPRRRRSRAAPAPAECMNRLHTLHKPSKGVYQVRLTKCSATGLQPTHTSGAHGNSWGGDD